VYVRLPKTAGGKKVPVVLLLTGLDGIDQITRAKQWFLARGWGCVIAEIPGLQIACGSCGSEECRSIVDDFVDWMEEQESFDMRG